MRNVLAAVGMAVLGLVTAALVAAAVGSSGHVTGAGSTPGYVAPGPAPSPVAHVAIPKGARALIFGDSYTYGTGASDPSRGFAPLTAAALDWHGDIHGYPGEGYRTKPTFQQSLAALTVPAPQVVVVVGGLNDRYYSGDVQTAADSFVRAVHARWPGVPVILVGPIDPSGNQADLIDAVNSALYDVATTQRAAFIKASAWFPPSSLHGLIAADGEHPNDAGHALLAQRLAAAIRALTA